MGIGDLDFGMADGSTGARHAHKLLGAKSPFVERDGAGRALDTQIRRNRVVSLRNGSNFCFHKRLLWVEHVHRIPWI